MLFQLNEEEQIILAYNFSKKKVVGKHQSKLSYFKISIHPTR